MKKRLALALFLAMVSSVGFAATGVQGPLRRHPTNPRYFTDDSGRAVLLTGSHTWNNLVDMGESDPPPRFDYDAHLNWLAAYPHNFFRLWTWELTTWDTAGNREKNAQVHRAFPQPWKRSGPGNALDGKPKFNLKEFDDEYFGRLRQRVKAAQDRGIYVAVMLFEGWGLQFSPEGWRRHPFHSDNNVNGINGDLDGDGKGLEIHTGRSREITELQRSYVRKVVDTVNEFDNVLYEISNENHPPSTQWQYDMIRLIHEYERTKRKQHPVGMTFQYKGGSNKVLFDSPADWISPNPDGGYRDDPPAADGSKVIVNDTDHLWGTGGNAPWVWKSLLRGMNPIFMDPCDGKILSKSQDLKWTEPIRRAMGYALQLSRRVDLGALIPRGELASSKYCLANPGKEYMAYLPEGKEVTVDVGGGAQAFEVEWLNPETGQTTKGQSVQGGGKVRFTSTLQSKDAVLHLKHAGPAGAAIREERFDQEPANWEGINNRGTHFEIKTVVQDFGYSDSTRHAGGQPGEVGGKINPAGETAYYGYRLPKTLSLDDAMSASGKILVARGANHFLLGFFNADTAKEWRTRNSMVARINGRGDGFHCHVEYCGSRWRCEAGVIGAIVRGERIDAIEIPGGRVYEWQLTYDPKGAEGSGLLTFTLDGKTATCTILKEHRVDGATFTHFGLLPVLKAWDSPGEVWMDDVTVNGKRFDFGEDPRWDGLNNRRTYQTKNTRPRFDFGWSLTHLAGGKAAGELGGLIFRGDCRDERRMAAYGDRISTLTLNGPLYASGKVAMTRGVSDSTASIGFYHSTFSMRSNPRQNRGIPMDYVGINIEGPSSEGFFFYPVYRVHGDAARALGWDGGKAPRVLPDGKVHDWTLKYDPAGANGNGRITVSLDDQTCTLDLEPGAKTIGASFNRFGICTPWIDGNSVTAFFDDLQYTCDPAKPAP